MLHMDRTIAPGFLAQAQLNGIRAQKGVSLFLSLIALVVMTLAGLALIRAVDTTNLLSGNMAFKDATVNIADRGTAAAVNYLSTNVVGAIQDGNLPNGCTAPNCQYYANTQSNIEDTHSVPGFNWSSTNIPVVNSDGYSYQFVIERMCNQATVVTTNGNPQTETGKDCFALATDPGPSNRTNASNPTGNGVIMVYRVTTRATGPRNAQTIVQTILSR